MGSKSKQLVLLPAPSELLLSCCHLEQLLRPFLAIFYLFIFLTVDGKFACVEVYGSSHPEAPAGLLFWSPDRI